MNKEETNWHDTLTRRVIVCTALMLGVITLLILRLWQVQVIQGSEHLQASRRQSFRPIQLNPVRGRIFAADNSLLVDNVAEYDLVFHLVEMRQSGPLKKTIEHVLETERVFAFLFHRQSQLTEAEVRRHIYYHPVLPLHVFQCLTPWERAVMSELSPPMSGVEILARNERQYNYPGIASHILGHSSWDNPEGTAWLDDFPRVYTSTQLRGRSGLESYYERDLAGKPGARLVVVDSMGYDRKTVSQEAEPIDGNDLVLTLDLRAQIAAEAVMEGHKGALVVVDVHNGAIIALASSPTYSLANLTRRGYASLARDNENLPLFNRAINGTYTPGSIMKPLMALALLQEDIITEFDTYNCEGKLKLGDFAIHCAKRYGHGNLDVVNALRFSCNPFFMHFGLELGIDRWQPYLTSAGIGELSGIDYPESQRAKGVRPDRAFAKKTWNRNWLPIDMAYASIGQGAITVTPLQAAIYVAALANGGVVYRPYFVQKIVNSEGEILREAAPFVRHRLPVSEENLRIVQQGMKAAVYVGGSAASMRTAGIEVAAKTGTAEVGSGEGRHKNTWVIAYGPVDEPEFALVCLVERGESGGKTAAPLASQFLRLWKQEETE